MTEGIKVKLATVVEGDPKDPFQLLQYRAVGEGVTSFPGLVHFTFDSTI